MGSDLTCRLHVALAQDEPVISVKFDIGSYYHGAAHPNAYSHVVIYDLKNGKPIKIGGLVQAGREVLAAISAFCIADLKKQSRKRVCWTIRSRKGAGRTRRTSRAGRSRSRDWESPSTPTRSGPTPGPAVRAHALFGAQGSDQAGRADCQLRSRQRRL
jgi:hypothetical protein